MGVSSWSVIGHSFGAAFSCHYALDCPEAVDKLVVTNSRSAFSEPRRFNNPQMSGNILAGLREDGARTLKGLPYHPRHMRGVSAALKSALIDDAERIHPDAIAQTLQHTVPSLNVYHRLQDLCCPVLLTNCTREQAFQPIRDQLGALIPTFSTANMEAGHSPNAETPAEWNKAVMAFLREQ